MTCNNISHIIYRVVHNKSLTLFLYFGIYFFLRLTKSLSNVSVSSTEIIIKDYETKSFYFYNYQLPVTTTAELFVIHCCLVVVYSKRVELRDAYLNLLHDLFSHVVFLRLSNVVAAKMVTKF